MNRLETFLGELLGINPNIDIGLIEKAYEKAEQMHEGQMRKSGDPYLVHPIEVSKILAELGMDERAIAAGLLHDAVEDTPYSIEDVREDFGSDIALLVDGVTKLGSLAIDTKEERQAENMRKMFLAMSKDIRVLIIKLADRLHNLRTINYMNRDQILEKCRETIEIYAPLAGRLGIYTIKFELEDIALKYLDTEAYYRIVDQVKEKRDERSKAIENVIDAIKNALDELGIAYEITGRSKHFYSIYNKMKYQNKQIDEIFDLTAVRIIVDTVKDCYTALGMVHTMWKPLPGRFKDYIAMPKPNRYQSLHTTMIDEKGQPFEIQIRTWAMHRIAEYGIAAHWKYKEGSDGDQEEVKLAWLRQTLEWNQDINDPREFMETLKLDLFSNQVFVLTPKGDVVELPAGSTPLDFAFKIHTDIGAKCVGAKINGKMVPIDYTLHNGEIVNILTQNNSKGPSIDWLKIAKSSNAKSKIRQWLKKQDKSLNIDRGKDLLEKSVRRKGYDTHDIIRNTWILRIAKELKFSSSEDLYHALSNGGLPVRKVVSMLEALYAEEKSLAATPLPADAELKKLTKGAKSTGGAGSGSDVVVEGAPNMLVRFSKCCSPLPGDEITGFVTKGRGLSIHRTDCVNILNLREEDRARLMAVSWSGQKKQGVYDADIVIRAQDRKGLFSDVSRKCVELDVNIVGIGSKTYEDGSVIMNLKISVESRDRMDKILRTLRGIESVLEVKRSGENIE
ncbi:MAG: bifunctional (p)ppGpp synthetase/guanosine-3',5'-bis(diphosphate) 3'-pyrophosphohydrolase [Clostridiales Family XIII bacterium]|jgi:GTP pyrophosphokinase|nr:bifunctional (p)ppGpp synthetase/guanosine-3',5'-bis(diphosphate) 3'-pyrophosphohydrolase [Clostridiales Family XIII bacterium]